jgi:transposase
MRYGEWLAGQSGIVAELALQELADIARLTEDINALEKRITSTVREVAPRLYRMPGCGALAAAKIMGETALVTRFSSEAAFAQNAGLAPVPQWSAERIVERAQRGQLTCLAGLNIRGSGVGHADCFLCVSMRELWLDDESRLEGGRARREYVDFSCAY